MQKKIKLPENDNERKLEDSNSATNSKHTSRKPVSSSADDVSRQSSKKKLKKSSTVDSDPKPRTEIGGTSSRKPERLAELKEKPEKGAESSEDKDKYKIS